MDGIYELDLNSEVFHALAFDFKFMLQKSLLKMQETKSKTGDISLKLSIEVSERMDPDNGELSLRPFFQHKITSVIQMKSETQGLSDADYELIFDADEMVFRVAKRNEQLSLI